MTSILETARQLVEWRALAKTSGDLGKDGFARVQELIKLGFPETIHKNEAAIAAALVEADGHLSNLASMLEAAHRQLGIYSKENKRLVAARAFLSRISTASTTYDAIREELKGAQG